MFRSILLLCGLALVSPLPASSPERIPLNRGWQFRQADMSGPWRSATVPGSIYRDLHQHGQIPDPYADCSHRELAWIAETAWVYRLEFEPPVGAEAKERLFLVFSGLDTLAEIRLNGSPLLETNNMFRSWSVEVTKRLQPGRNTLDIHFHPILPELRRRSAGRPLPLPGGDWAEARKAAFQFGWDFAPRLPGCGIWQEVTLERRSPDALRSADIVTLAADAEKALMSAEFIVDSLEGGPVVLKVADESGRLLCTGARHLHRGENSFSLPFTIKTPSLWWPAGMGAQTLTPLTLILEQKGRPSQFITQSVGIRRIELITRPDDRGSSFYFQVNGRPFFARGANAVPPDSLLPGAMEGWSRLVRDARASGMNMLRIWGGGIYPPKAFFDACDRAGILIWQDFMFACSMYPYDPAFLENVAHEARQQIIRLRGHPSLALWCGNNEIDEGWHNWGWQKELAGHPEYAKAVWEGYQALFHGVLAGLVRELDPKRPYHPSSPQFGWGRSESMTEGDAHYWGVWWGGEPFSVYREKVPRFMSEFGFQALPHRATVRSFSSAPQNPREEDLACHQKHPRGFEIIQEAMTREGFAPRNLDERIYQSQILQALGIQTAIEAQRLSMPHCMGSLYWQFNDCWPGISWSGIDYFGRWKALQYQVRRSFAPLLVQPVVENGRIRVKAHSEHAPDPSPFRLHTRILSLGGRELCSWQNEGTIGTVASELLLDIPLPGHIGTGRDWVIHCELQRADLRAQGFAIPGAWGELPLESPGLSWKRIAEGRENALEIHSEKPAFFVEILDERGMLRPTDNFFHLLPGQRIRIALEGPVPPNITMRSLWNTKN